MLLLFSGILVFILLSEYSPRSHSAGEVNQGPGFGVRPVTLMNDTEKRVRVFDVCLVDGPPGLEEIPITCNVKIAEIGRYAGGFNGQVIQAHYEGVSLFKSNTLSIQKAGNYALSLEKCGSLDIALLATPPCIVFSVGNEWQDPTAAPTFRNIGSFHLTPYKPSSDVFLYVVLLLSILALGIVGISRNRKLSAVEVKKAVKRESQFEMDWDSTEGDNDTVSELKVPLPENEKDWRDLFDKIYQEGGSGSKLLPTNEDAAASRRESDGTSFLNDYWKI